MIKAIDISEYGTPFCADPPEVNKKTEEATRILPNTPQTRIKQGFQKTSSAFLDYPVKGLKGDINSNFYEFLAMGIVPYLLGSGMFMAVFNVANRYCTAKGRQLSSATGHKLALGVVMYGLFKTLSKNFVTIPVKQMTGIDTEMPYENIVYPLPKEAGEAAEIEVQHQQRKVYDSKEFYRKDLLDRSYFDKVAKKLGLGDNLNDSITETSPIIQNVVATTNTAKSLSSYSWAGLGVALAVNDAWLGFFEAIKGRKRYAPPKDASIFGKAGCFLKTAASNTWKISKSFFTSFGKSCKQLWIGPESDSFYMKHAGKIFASFTIGLTALLTANAIIRAKNMAKNNNKYTIDKNKESTVI